MDSDAHTTTRYVAPGAITRRIGNPLVKAIVALGITPWGASNIAPMGEARP